MSLPGYGTEPGLWSCPEATCRVGNTEESDGGQFPSHPGRPGPETSSEGAHLTPNPQEIQAGFTPSLPLLQPPLPSLFLHLTIHPSIRPRFYYSKAEKPRKFKASVRARANPRAAFPRARADEILFFARKNYRGRGEKKQKIK